MSRHNLWRNTVLFLAATLVTAAIVEAVLRGLVRTSDDCYGNLAGVELPPCRLRSPYGAPLVTNRPEPYRDLVVDNRKITYGDLWGIARHDPVLGYTALEGATSANGWWRTDRLGARVGRESNESGPVTARILVFGDSYAVGSRLPFEETWSFALDDRHPAIAVSNFAMDGYSTAQAYLRYLSVRPAVEHDVVLLVLVPEEALWRDVNVRRDVGAGWPIYWVLPRFDLVDDSLRLIQTPFPGQGSDLPHPPEDTDQKLKDHLRAFDRLYFDSMYEQPSGLGRAVVARLMTAAAHKHQVRQFRAGLMDADSEALRISAAILRAMHTDVVTAGKRFAVAVLPTEWALEDTDREFWETWDRMIDVICGDGIPCIDLSQALRRIPDEEIDRGYDGSHFGPVLSREIGRALGDGLSALDLIPSRTTSGSPGGNQP
jgi:hypothetical protein